MNTNIYVLSDGYNFYIGKADNVEGRYWQHLNRSFQPKSPKYYRRISVWIRSLGSNAEDAANYIGIYKVKEVPQKDWKSVEIKAIAAYREHYGRDRVMNMTDGGESFASGEDHPNAKFTWEEVQYIRQSGKHIKELSRELEVPHQTISNIIHNRTYHDPEYIPNYVPASSSAPKESLTHLSWYHIFFIRSLISYHCHYSHRFIKETIRDFTKEFGSIASESLIKKVSCNFIWIDPHWDPGSHSYTGPPHSWDESWGAWD